MIPASLTQSLAYWANIAIVDSLTNGAFGQNKPTGEVGFVAAIVLGAVSSISTTWRRVLQPHGFSIRLTGVFCHQTPRASFTDSTGNMVACELADLLVVVDDLTSGHLSTRRAVLIQAKMAQRGGGKTLASMRDLIQLDLLSNWPPFTLPSSFAPGARDFNTCKFAGSPVDCGRYGLIEPQPSPKWKQHAPAQSMPHIGEDLGTYLAHMVESGPVGYGREASGTGDDWSGTVNELLNVTGSLVFAHVAGFQGKRPRKNVQVAFATSSSIDLARFFTDTQLPTGGKPERPDYEEEAGGQGISLIHIGVERDDG